MQNISLTVHKLHPENKETPIQFIETDILPPKLFYRRNHFSYPPLTYSFYWLPINGHVQTPRIFSMQEIMKFPSKTIKVALECAGDKRGLFDPKVFGEQWEKGGISQGYWKGVSLRTLLEAAGIKDGVKEVVVEGYDYGKRTDLEGVVPFKRSLPVKKALHPDTIIAYEYNNQPIPFKHGYPLRLIVPQWYGMASVKWIKQITLIDSHFTGPFQSMDYVYFPNKNNDEGAVPVTGLKVNSTIQKPLDREILNIGKHVIKGIAWTGKGEISKVDISTDNGQTWAPANLLDPSPGRYGWVPWSYEWTVEAKGEYTIMSKAADSSNRIQPSNPFWNRKGYGYNAWDQITVKIE
ncbi:sulfite oxidase [Paenibacillus sp. BSR1-1]|uniref:sulfite oxidase n=1 Tax=Paenibacillus sp. BSR1-1 TaxID=3020845 RepID=UPI0025B14EFE|nr:sulfite oxidase [Paenibacillus sp. BSR1-1]MDN3016349.1 sulfite oxidase [Paenibacillus sp. BSR1-1]